MKIIVFMVVIVYFILSILIYKKKCHIINDKIKTDHIIEERYATNNYNIYKNDISDIYLNIAESVDIIVKLITNATKTIELHSFCMDIENKYLQNKSLDEHLNEAYLRGVKVTLYVNNYQYNYDGSNKSILNKYKDKYDIYVIKNNCRLLSNIKYCNYHRKLLIIDKKYLYIGGGIDNNKDGISWKSFEECRYDVCWTDTGILTHYNKNFKYNSLNEYCQYLYLIRNSKNFLYIENQFIDSNIYTYNNIIVEIAKRLCKSIKNNDNLRVVIVTNTKETIFDEKFILRIYVDLCTKNILKTVYNYCKDNLNIQNKEILISELNKRFKVCYLIKDNKYPIDMHAQIFIQDGERLIKSSSNLTDRSISIYQCDKEYGLLFESPTKIKTFLKKIWNHRLNTENINHDYKDVFDLISINTGQYRCIELNKYYKHTTSFFKDFALLLKARGPCKDAKYEYKKL